MYECVGGPLLPSIFPQGQLGPAVAFEVPLEVPVVGVCLELLLGGLNLLLLPERPN